MKQMLATFVVLAALGSAASACPMCKDSVPNKEGASTPLRDSSDPGGQNISGGINASVYVMLGTLFATMGLVSTVIIKGLRSSAGQRELPLPPADPNAK